ncbi:MAG: Imm8 family immunity protein [FCB group bacterium]
MVSKIKEILTPNFNDLKTYIPENISNFKFPIQLLIGPKESEGEESFEIIICSPSWLMDNIPDGGYLHGQHYLILKKYNSDVLLNCLNILFNNIEGNNWDEIALKLSHFAIWEFDNYKEHV